MFMLSFLQGRLYWNNALARIDHSTPICTVRNIKGRRELLERGIITINLRGIYTAPCIMILMRGLDITRAIGRVVLKVDW